MNPLISIKELKTNYWQKLMRENIKPVLHYDEVIDTFFVYISPKEKERIITHFIDDYVAFLYRHSDKEIVGVKVEYFKKSFLPKYSNKNWMLSKTGIHLDSIRDFVFKIELSNTSPINQLTPNKSIESKVHPEPVFA